MRGNGVLVLTEKKLIFRQAVPARWFEIPLEMVQGIEHPRNFMGKGHVGSLLVVNYRNDAGEDDAIGWAVREPLKWGEKINSERDRSFGT